MGVRGGTSLWFRFPAAWVISVRLVSVGNASLPVPFAAACSVGALWPAFWVGVSGRDTPGRFRCARSTSPGLASSCPARTSDTGCVGLLRLLAGWRGAELVLHSARRWRAKRIGTSQDGYATFTSCGNSTSPPPWASAYDGAASRARLRDHWRRPRGHDALSGMSDGVYSLLRLHDHGMPGVISDTGSDSVPLGRGPSCALPVMVVGGGDIDVPRRQVGCRCGDSRTRVLCGSNGSGTFGGFSSVRDQGWLMEGNGLPRSGVGGCCGVRGFVLAAADGGGDGFRLSPE